MERGRAQMTQLKLSMFEVSVIVLSFEYLLQKLTVYMHSLMFIVS